MSWYDDYRESLARWSSEWQPEIRIVKIRRLRWRGTWTGPYGGKHVHYAMTRTGVIVKAKQEIAGWTKKLRKQDKRRARRGQVERVRLR